MIRALLTSWIRRMLGRVIHTRVSKTIAESPNSVATTRGAGDLFTIAMSLAASSSNRSNGPKVAVVIDADLEGYPDPIVLREVCVLLFGDLVVWHQDVFVPGGPKFRVEDRHVGNDPSSVVDGNPVADPERTGE